MKKNWKHVASKIVHENPWYRVREDDVVRPDGSLGKYFVIDGINSVAVIAGDKDGSYYLVEQSRYPLGSIRSLEVVTGGIKNGKDPLSVAQNELQEETGLIANKWESIGYFYPMNGYDEEKCYVFLATELVCGKNNLEPTEDIEIRKLKVEEIIDLIEKNEISCGITIAAFYKYLLWKDKE